MAQLNPLLLNFVSPGRLLGSALGLGAIASILLSSPLTNLSETYSIVFLAMAVAALGLTSSNAAALSMGAVQSARGGASGLLGALQFGFGFLASRLTAALDGDQARGLA